MNDTDTGALRLKTITDFFELLICLAVTFAAAYGASRFTAPAIGTWYEGLRKPSFTPPNAVFEPVWTIMYTLMAAAAFLAWRVGFKNRYTAPALAFFIIQLGLNFFWSVIFFGWHQPFWAWIEIIVLWFFILLTMVLFFRITRPAGVLLLPYLGWVTFAAVLNYYIWHTNS